jgi:translation initiation factor 3 subunit D
MDSIVINDNATSFGPPADFQFPQQFPFQPTEVNDRVLRFIDFSTQSKGEDEEFSMVDTKLQSKNKLLHKRGMLANAWNKGKQQQIQTKQQQLSSRPLQRKIYRDASIQVKPVWRVVAELNKQHFDKLTLTVKDPVDLRLTDAVFKVNSGLLATVSAKRPKAHDLAEGVKATYITTSEDPVMQELMAEHAGNVFLTDSILSTLMTVLRSVYSWDIEVTKTGDRIVFDKVRNGIQDEMSVNENADVPPEDDDNPTVINSAKNLAEECSRVNLAFRKIALAPTSLQLGDAHPSGSGQVYRYRKWTLSENIHVVVRTEVDAYIDGTDKPSYEKLRAVNEYDSAVTGGYRASLSSQSGKVIGNEVHNNGCKLSKWTLQAHLAGVESMRLGFFVRSLITKADKHLLVGVNKFHVSQLATNLNLSIPNCWGMFVGLVELLRMNPDGKYILIKDPNRLILRLYACPEENDEEI